MATQASTLYANNVRHMVDDLTPNNDGKIKINMKDDVVRGAMVTHSNKITFPPPPPKVSAIAKAPSKPQTIVDPEIVAKLEAEKLKKSGRKQLVMLILGGLLMLFMGAFAPPSFMQHFIVFVLACFIGFQVIWNVSHALHTPLMAITNAISGIIILGALLQINTGIFLIELLAGVSILIATINIVGGFLVTRRMLSMFQKS
jgi:NAD(P) transhydrogenase subunit alpha